MNIRIFAMLLLCAVTRVGAQGHFFGASGTVRTRIGALDGPVAGNNILGQFLVGATTNSLIPVGPAGAHVNGTIYVGTILVPHLVPPQIALVQLVAWDSTQWGTNWAIVPDGQLGRTDIGTVFLSDGEILFAPQFTQPAIVPIPEPGVWSLAAFAMFAWFLVRWRRK